MSWLLMHHMSTNETILITKASGEIVPFNVERLRHSLKRARAKPEAIEEVVKAVSASLYPGMTTKEIYRKAFSLLQKGADSTAARYKLKNAIMELGPAGFAFEKFVAALLQKEGYRTHTGEIVEGVCVKHEVDVIAERNNTRCMIECKFHGNQGKFSDVKVPLYIRSRFVDVAQSWEKNPTLEGKHFEGWVVTNTRFTSDAEQYGQCVGLTLLSWDWPLDEGLKDRIDRTGLHPITCLTTITRAEKKALLGKDVVLCADMCHAPKVLNSLGVSKNRINRILNEAQELCDL